MNPSTTHAQKQKVSKIKETVIRIAGDSQDGIQLVGDFLARLSGRSDMGVITFQTFPATISGGPSIFQVRIGSSNVRSAGDEADILVAFYQHSYRDHLKSLREGGILLYDADKVEPNLEDKRFRYVGVPMTGLTIEAIGGPGKKKGKNMFLFGLLANMFELDVKKIQEQMSAKFKPKGEDILTNALGAFHAGYGYDLGNVLDETYSLAPAEKKARTQVAMNGNQALAYGAICAGVRFGAGYPITPWSSSMEILRTELPKYGGSFIQAEDELAAVAMTIGSSYSGRIALTGTSGPGLSLKGEAIGWAVCAEVGLVVVDVQRGGPSTGLPTKVEQSDLNIACFGGHGDSPRVVIAPSTVEDCFYDMIEAVNIAKEYKVPVIFLTDQSLATRIETFQEPELKKIMQDISPSMESKKQVFPYEDTKSGVSETVAPGVIVEDGKYPVITGLEHNEAGHPDGTPENHIKMAAKRRRKLQNLAKKLPLPKIYGEEKGEILFVGWGTTKGPIEEAVDMLLVEGRKIGSINMKHLYPFPEGLEKIIDRFDHIVVVEMNDEGIYGFGQLAALLRARFVTDKIRSLNKADGLPFKIREILSVVNQQIDGKRG